MSMLNILRVWAVLLALSLMLGEVWRSWGAGRHFLFVIDDQLIGGLMLIAAYLLKKNTWRRRALFTGSWGIGIGMLYGSFFGKVIDSTSTNAGNWDVGILTALIGVAFVSAIMGFILSMVPPINSDEFS